MARNPTPAQQVAQILGAQLAPVRYAEKQARKQGVADVNNLNATRLSVIQALQAGVPVAKASYDEALGQTEHLAQNAAAMLGAANPNQTVQAELAAVNAPPEQRAQLANQAQAQFGGQAGVLYTQHGSIPGANLLAQREAHLGLLAGLPTVAALSSEETLRGLKRLQQDALNKYVTDTMGVTAQAPALLSQLTQRQQDVQFRNRQFAADQAYRQVQATAAAAEAKARATGDAQDRADANYWKGVEAQQRDRSLALQAKGSQPTGLDIYKAKTDRINATQARQQATASAKSDGISPAARREYRAKAQQLKAHTLEARQAFLTKKTDAKGNILVPAKPTYDQAVQLAEQQGIPTEIAVPILNTIFPAQYQVTARGTLQQTGIRGYPSTFAGGGGRRRRKRGK